MKPLYTLLFLCVLFIVSCSNENDAVKDIDKADLVLSSDHFQSLNVSASALDLENVITETSPAGNEMIIIAYKDKSLNNHLISVLANEKEIRFSTVVQFESPQNEDFSKAFEENRFEGKLSFATSSGDYFGLDFKASKIVNMFALVEDTQISNSNNAKTEVCAYWTKTGGVFDCAGASLVAEGPTSKFFCYIDFIPCMAAKMMDCYLNGCIMQYPTGNLAINKNGFIVVNPSIKSKLVNFQ
jgi:hypothetical protein